MQAIRRQSTATSEGTRPAGDRQYAVAGLVLALAVGACGAPAPSGGDVASGAPAERVLPGIDVLLLDPAATLAGGRVGLITNHTGITADGRSTIDALMAAPGVRLAALFGPEHGLRGQAEAGATVESGRDPVTGLPFRSLYGETRKPLPAMLADIDVLVFDIQDTGVRYYTYVWTMALALQAAGENGVRFVVLDRPNPIGGALVQGNVLDPAFATFVGLYPVPMRHGLTVGELARMLNAEFALGADLTVIPVQGWRRDMPFPETGLPWRAPSPNMPSVESAYHYAGTCLFEGTNLSVGRGTPEAFALIGAPWLDATAVIERLEARGLPGVDFEATTFTPAAPGDDKYDRVEIAGIRFRVTDPASYDPTRTALAALLEIRALHADRLTFREAHFDRLAGTDRVRLGVLGGQTLEQITAGWPAEIEAFLTRRATYLLYQ